MSSSLLPSGLATTSSLIARRPLRRGVSTSAAAIVVGWEWHRAVKSTPQPRLVVVGLALGVNKGPRPSNDILYGSDRIPTTRPAFSHPIFDITYAFQKSIHRAHHPCPAAHHYITHHPRRYPCRSSHHRLSRARPTRLLRVSETQTLSSRLPHLVVLSRTEAFPSHQGNWKRASHTLMKPGFRQILC